MSEDNIILHALVNLLQSENVMEILNISNEEVNKLISKYKGA